MIYFTVKKDWKNTDDYLKKLSSGKYLEALDKYGEMGVEALQAHTPKLTGKTSESWYYEIKKGRSGYTINWMNSNVNEGTPIAIILQYGHGTRNGGYVQGIDYINPSMNPIFEKIAEDAWKEVSNT
jgi:hypothetical protein